MSFQDLEAGSRSLNSRPGNFANGRQDPTQAVASGIFQINTIVSTFQRLVNTLGTPKDTPELRQKLYTNGEADATLDKSSEQQALLMESRRQEFLHLDNEIVFNETIIEERARGIQDIEQQIGQYWSV